MSARFAAPCECCSVRQDIQWDAAAAAFFTSLGRPGVPPGVPHGGFPATPAGTWIEDRDSAGTMYGHREDAGETEYTPDQATGCNFDSTDNPGGPAAMTGQWQFRLRVVDACGNTVATSAVITINW